MTADIKPVAWFATYKSGELIRNYGDGSAVYACETEEDAKRVTRIHLGASGDVVALYPQSAIDSLRGRSLSSSQNYPRIGPHTLTE